MPLGVAVLYNFKSGVAIVRVLEYNRHINHGGRIMEIMSAREAANKWGISQRRVALLCSEGRIAQAQMVGNSWAIPKTAAKPTDGRSLRYTMNDGIKVKPFLKWAGGKGQLLSEIEKYYPFSDSHITKYAEPFVGGGAVLFDVLGRYDLEAVYISDINADLINAYTVVRDNIDRLIERLSAMQDEYLPMDTDNRKVYYMANRKQFNETKTIPTVENAIYRAALLIFLNKTCFNGLYRVNRKGFYNVPMGAYKNPMICDEENLRAVSHKLQGVKIVCGDYKKSAEFVDNHTFVYFDPPYRPLTETSSFTAYTEDCFNDEKQRELARFVGSMNSAGAKIVVSNSDPKNTNPDDDFFDEIYSEQRIRRVEATRMINSNSDARGKIKELLISNF